jgi:hypothetical protein
MAMKRVEHYLQMYFWDTPIVKVIPARLKLAWAQKCVPEIYTKADEDTCHCKNGYYKRKRMSVLIAEALVGREVPGPKKDDLADAYVQARAFIQKYVPQTT